MRKLLYTGITVLLTCCFYSCKKDFLQTTSTDSYYETNWWQTQEQVISSINGCYAALRTDQISGTTALREENLSPNSFGFGADSPLDVGDHNAGNHNGFYAKWNALYNGIGRVNNLLENIDRVKMDATLLQRIKGEAFFLRAFLYSNLVNYFGGVPLILESPNLEKQRNQPRNTRQEVIDQVITDLNNAGSVLPTSYTGADIGRATKGAALALKTRVLLYEGKWSEAAMTAREVINMAYYRLFADYRGLFFPENEGNREVIFDVQYKAPEFPNSFDLIIEVQINIAPTLDLVNSYLMKDGKSIKESPLYDPAKPYENRDPRLHQTIVIPGYMYRGGVVNATKYFSTGFGFKKYTTYKDNVSQPNLQISEINFIHLRYADLLLMYAEAQNEVAGSDVTVYDALNQIRLRAGMPAVPAGLSKEQMREVIRLERRIELAGEARYYNDIRRWRTAEVELNRTDLNSKGQVVQKRSFNPQRDYLWPIHAITIQDNPALQQNPGY